jgi:cell division cycle-associated protein 7
LKNAEPVSYSELHTKTEKGSKVVKSGFIEEGAKEEVYTEDHEKLLGTCQIAWTLFVDGYDKDGKRIYDQVRGKTCHQCR